MFTRVGSNRIKKYTVLLKRKMKYQLIFKLNYYVEFNKWDCDKNVMSDYFTKLNESFSYTCLIIMTNSELHCFVWTPKKVYISIRISVYRFCLI